MFKRLLLVLALGAAIAACSSTGSSTSPGSSLTPASEMPSIVVESPAAS